MTTKSKTVTKRAPRPRISEAKRKLIIKRRASGWSLKRVAQQAGCSVSSVSSIYRKSVAK